MANSGKMSGPLMGDDDLMFAVDGIPPQAAVVVNTVLEWPVQLPSEQDLSPAAAQVLASARRAVLLLGPSASDPAALAPHLAAALPPSVRLSLRSSSPKRPANPTRDPSWALRSLRHTLLVATTEGGEELLIEPSFRPHFALPGCTEAYAAALDALPELLVLPKEAMYRLVNGLGLRLAAETALTGRTLPPWRTVSALLTKWMPDHYQDTFVPAPAHATIPAAAPASFTFLPTGGLARVSDSSFNSDSSGSVTPLGMSPDSVLPGPHSGLVAADKLAAQLLQARARQAPAVVVMGFAVQKEQPVVAAAPVFGFALQKEQPIAAAAAPRPLAAVASVADLTADLTAAPVAADVAPAAPAVAPLAANAVVGAAAPATPASAAPVAAAVPASAAKLPAAATGPVKAVTLAAAASAAVQRVRKSLLAPSAPAATSNKTTAAPTVVVKGFAVHSKQQPAPAGPPASPAPATTATTAVKPPAAAAVPVVLTRTRSSTSSGLLAATPSFEPRLASGGVSKVVLGGVSKGVGNSSGTSGGGVSKVVSSSRAQQLLLPAAPRGRSQAAAFALLLPRVHTVRPAGPPVDWEKMDWGEPAAEAGKVFGRLTSACPVA